MAFRRELNNREQPKEIIDLTWDEEAGPFPDTFMGNPMRNNSLLGVLRKRKMVTEQLILEQPAVKITKQEDNASDETGHCAETSAALECDTNDTMEVHLSAPLTDVVDQHLIEFLKFSDLAQKNYAEAYKALMACISVFSTQLEATKVNWPDDIERNNLEAEASRFSNIEFEYGLYKAFRALDENFGRRDGPPKLTIGEIRKVLDEMKSGINYNGDEESPTEAQADLLKLEEKIRELLSAYQAERLESLTVSLETFNNLLKESLHSVNITGFTLDHVYEKSVIGNVSLKKSTLPIKDQIKGRLAFDGTHYGLNPIETGPFFDYYLNKSGNVSLKEPTLPIKPPIKKHGDFSGVLGKLPKAKEPKPTSIATERQDYFEQLDGTSKERAAGHGIMAELQSEAVINTDYNSP